MRMATSGETAVRKRRPGLMVVIVTLMFVGIAFVTCGTSAQPGASIRIVASSLAPGERKLTITTQSLYAKDDPWKAYLAGESVCPGGERIDLPALQQAETVACLVNFARKRRGLQPLIIQASLNGASVKKAKAIVNCQTFAHNPCGRHWMSSVRSTGYAGLVGENLYVAAGRWGAPRVAIDAWLNSKSHRENLFARRWREQGIAVLPNESFGGYRNVALWVSVLGHR